MKLHESATVFWVEILSVFGVWLDDDFLLSRCPLDANQLIEVGTIVAIVVVVEGILEDVPGVRQGGRGELPDGPLAILEHPTDGVQLEV